MKRLLFIAVLALSVQSFAQTQAALPDLIESYQSGTLADPNFYQVVLHNGVTAGDLIHVSVAYHNSCGSSAFAITDTQSNTYTLTTLLGTPSPQSNNSYIYQGYTVVGSTTSSAVTVSVSSLSACGSVTMIADRIPGLTGTLDGSVQSGTQGGSSSQTVSTTNTTATNGPVLVSCTVLSIFGTNAITQSGAEEYLSKVNEPAPLSFCTFEHADAPGSYTMTDNLFLQFAFGSNSTVAKQTIAFKATTAIPDTIMPDGIVGGSYLATIHGVGGTAPFIYSLNSGPIPPGLTINNSTGQITGTPTLAGLYTGTYKIDDGAGNTATASLTIQIGTAFATPTVTGHLTTDANSNPSSTSLTVGCGERIAIIALGDDTHADNGWLQTINDTNNYWKGSKGETYSRVGWLPGVTEAPVMFLLSTPTTSAGTDTISWANTGAASSGLKVAIIRLSGVSGVVERVNATNYALINGSLSISASYTTTRPNTLLIAAGSSAVRNLDSMTSAALSSPFTTIDAAANSLASLIYAYDLVSSPGSVSTTFSGSDTPGTAIASAALSIWGLLPSATVPTCPTQIIRHRSLLY